MGRAGSAGPGTGGGSAPPGWAEIAAVVDRLLPAQRVTGDPAGIVQRRDRLVATIGLPLDPVPGLLDWIEREEIGAFVVHRPWRLPPERLPGVGVLAHHHLAFDEEPTTGHNPRLAAALGMVGLKVLGRNERRPIVMIGDVPAQTPERFRRAVTEEFGGLDRVIEGTSERVARVAVVGAMTAKLVGEVAARRVDAYVTGQVQEPARAAVAATGLAVLAVGHRRAEWWGCGRWRRRCGRGGRGGGSREGGEEGGFGSATAVVGTSRHDILALPHSW